MRLFLLSIAFLPNLIFAGGFQLNVQGQEGLGTGGASVARYSDASSIFFNPGASAFLSSNYNFTFGTSLIFPAVSVQTEFVTNEDQTSPIATPVQFYGAGKANEKLTIGFGINNQFGSTSRFDDNWEGKYIVQEQSLKTFMYQPTLSYKIIDRLSIGAGFVYTTGSFGFKKAVPVATSEYDYGQVNLSGKGSATSYNIGIQGIVLKGDSTQFIKQLSVGASYRSKINLELNNGTAQFSNISVALQDKFPEETAFTASLVLPSVISSGLQLELKPMDNIAITVVFDLVRTNWSSYDSLKIDFKNPETPDTSTPKKWKDVNTYRGGFSIGYKEKLEIRLGGYYDQSPILDGYVSPELPGKDNLSFTTGLGYQINSLVSVDISWLYSNFSRTETNNVYGFNGEYRRMVNVVGLGLNIAL
ncbi:MAG: outer membrane protein transport protein [Flavobacteriales bacterium]|nr:outer membrane protein transport protein [Flavobacteriales bacterium]